MASVILFINDASMAV